MRNSQEELSFVSVSGPLSIISPQGNRFYSLDAVVMAANVLFSLFIHYGIASSLPLDSLVFRAFSDFLLEFH